MEKRWTTIHLPGLPRVHDLSPALVHILLSRGIPTDQMHSFIQAGPALIRPSLALPALQSAISQIQRNLERNVRITVVGDYDADGVTASVLLYEVLKDLGATVEILIPDRHRDGYGISPQIVERINTDAAGHHQMIITVDNGANAREAIARALELGMEVVVTDHHTVHTHPEAVIMVNPNNPKCPYVFGGLAGVGVAWKLARELLKVHHCEEKAWDYLDLVALGTIADVSPLIDENRALVQLGMEKIKRNPRPGLRELIKRQLGYRLGKENGGSLSIANGSSITSELGIELSPYDIGMYITPCLNAAGRIGEVQDAVRLLLCQNQTEAAQLADKLIALNQERRRITEQGLKEAQSLLASTKEIPNIICLTLPEIEESICGIIAGRIKEAYQRPTLVLTQTKDRTWKGSGRSVNGFDITTLLPAVAHLAEGGGHPQACGVSLNDTDVDAFLATVQAFGEERITPQQLMPVIRVDLPVQPEEVTLGLLREIKKLEPFGAGWEEPVIGLRRVAVTGGVMGQTGEHLRLRCNRSGLIFKGWHMFSKYRHLGLPSVVDILGRLRYNFWNNRESSEVEILDLRSHRAASNG